MAQDRRTPLFDEHLGLGATMTSFAGWELPLTYSSHLAEHHAVRRAAGLFDVSHMGRVRVSGERAGELLDRALVGRLSGLAEGQARYTLLCAPDGGIIDDLLVYRLSPTDFLLVPNAASTRAVLDELTARAPGFDVALEDATDETALLAVQGPAAEAVLRTLAEDATAVRDLPRFRSAAATVAGVDVRLARTGYTGEDGFELVVASPDAVALWRALLDAGAPHGLVPAGLAARDSLRLEAGMPLYGNELSSGVDPFTAGLGGIVPLAAKTSDFAGRAALEAAAAAHAAAAPGRRVLVGLAGRGRRAARPGNAVLAGDGVVGAITSGMPSPTLGHPIALALVDVACAEVGTRLDVDVRGRREAFDVVGLPFYRRPRA